MGKLKTFLSKLFTEFVLLSKHYGFRPAFYTLIWWLNFYISTPFRFALSKWALLKKTKWLDKHIERNYSIIIDKYKRVKSEREYVEKPIIWIFWGQGEECMPALVSSCFRQLKVNHENVVLITNKNINEYIEISSIIQQKVKTGQITWAHFSDVVRTSLLYKYGGLWLDATLWVPSKISFNQLKEFDVYSANGEQKLNNRSICFWTSLNFNWSGWCLWSNQKESSLYGFVSEMLSTMVINEKMTLDYVLIDYLIYYAATHFPEVNEQMMRISSMRCNQKNTLATLMNEPFDEKKYGELCLTDNFFKLSFRAPWKATTPDGRLTFYGKLFQN